MEKQLQIFTHEEFGQVRVIEIDGELWFVASDVASVLGFGNPRQALKTHVDDEDKGVQNLDTPGGTQAMTVINESGLYSLILRSNLDSAKKFKRWVTSEVLPAIRKTGSYTARKSAFENSLKKEEALPPTAAVVYDIRKTVEQLQSLFAIKDGIAISQAIDLVGAIQRLPIESLKQFIPPAEHETGYLNATRIGAKLGGIKPQFVNRLLEKGGFLYKDGKNWRLTDKGKKFGEEMPYTKNGHSGYQIRWHESIVEEVRAVLAQAA